MSGRLNGRRVAILATDGVEEAELTEPRRAVSDEGATVEIVSLESGEIQAMESDITPTGTYPVDKVVGDVSPEDYDALIMPGGTVNADRLRASEDAVSFVKGVFAAGRPVGAICHAPWTLVEADLVRGRTLTSFPSLHTDIRNAGGEWVDEEVVRDERLVTSRDPGDLPAFCAAIVENFAEAGATR